MPELTPLRLVDLALAITLLELLLLLALRRRDLVVTLLAGLGLMIALRLGLAGSSLTWIALVLGLSGLLHALDVRRRWPATRSFTSTLRESPP